VQAFTLFRQPTSNAVPLDVQPRLESWEGRDHPSQTALQTYLDHLEDTVGPELVAVRGDAAVSLDVGLPHDRPLTGGGGDLDNFLYPVVRRLGPSRFAAAWATKKHGRSSICAQSAVPASRDLPAGWRFAAVRTTKASESRAWKQEVAGQLPAVEPSLGAIELQLCFPPPSSSPLAATTAPLFFSAAATRESSSLWHFEGAIRHGSRVRRTDSANAG